MNSKKLRPSTDPARATALALVAGLVAIGGLTVTAAASARAGACERHARHATRKDAEALIYRVVRNDPQGAGPESHYYACARPRGKSILIGTDGPDTGEYGPEGTADGFLLAGRFTVAHDSSGESSYLACTKYMQMGCTPPQAWIEITDARSGRRVQIGVPYRETNSTWSVDWPVAISTAGAVAWLQPNSAGSYNLYATLTRPARSASGLRVSPHLIDAGNIAPKSIRLSEPTTLRWTIDGAARSRRLSG